MGDYLKPLRRKIGVLTLVMACVMMGMWGRSTDTTDTFLIAGGGMGKGSYSLISTREGLCWDYQLPVSYIGKQQRLWRTLECKEYFSTTNTIWRWRQAGFAYCEHHLFPTDDSICSDCYFIVPYWSIVSPLTVLAAWLLLSKPRQKSATRQ